MCTIIWTTYSLKYLGSPGIPDADFELSPSDDGESIGSNRNDVCGSSKCAERLALQGKTRAQLLANSMMQNGIVDKLSHVFSSQKCCTALTVEPTATMAGLTIEQFPTDGERWCICLSTGHQSFTAWINCFSSRTYLVNLSNYARSS